MFFLTFFRLQDEKYRSLALLGQLYKSDANETARLERKSGPPLPVISATDAFDNDAVHLNYVDQLVAAFHTCYVDNPNCQVTDICIAHSDPDCEDCDRESGLAWKYTLVHNPARKTYYVADSSHGYNPHK